MIERPEQLRAMTFENRAMALGLAVEHLMTKPAFARLPFGHWSRIIAGQIRRGHYFFIVAPSKVVGFCGWALASKAEAEAWIAGAGAALNASGEAGDCIVLNAWAADSAAVHRMILDEFRVRMHGSGRIIYAKRDYKDGRTRPLRLKLDGSFDSHALDALARRGG